MSNGLQWRIQDFPKVGAPTLPGVGAPIYDFAKFSQKLHEIERIRIRGCPKFYYIDPPLVCGLFFADVLMLNKKKNWHETTFVLNQKVSTNIFTITR